MSTAKITSGHLERLAVVYVRQSTPGQIRANRESAARQYALAERAQGFGWPGERVRTIDSDLGHSAGEKALGTRGGFQELCALIVHGRVGAVFGIEVSRLARNTIEWFQLLDLCRTHDVVLVEDDQVYAPGRDDDSLVLGLLCHAPHKMPYVVQPAMLGSMRNALTSRVFSPHCPT